MKIMYAQTAGSGTVVGCLATASSRLTDDIRQPTLIDLPEGRKAPYAGRLSLFDLVAVRVLELSSLDAAPLTPSSTLTKRLLGHLAQQGLIRLLAEDEASARAVVRSVYESASWVRGESFPHDQTIQTELGRLASRSGQSEVVQREQLDVWVMLASAELEGYARHLLRPYSEPELTTARLLSRLPLLLRNVGIASVRRALWVHLRGPQLVCPSTVPRGTESDFSDQLVARVFTAALRLQGNEANLQFLPAATLPAPLMRRVFMSDVCRLGHRYWLCPPSLSALKPDSEARGY